jgi:hypothetical protein
MPVAAPQLYVGQDAREALSHTREALDVANTRLLNDGAFYADVRSKLGE